MSVFSLTADTTTLAFIVILVAAVVTAIILAGKKIREKKWSRIQKLAGEPPRAPFRVQKIPAGSAGISPDTDIAATVPDLPQPEIDCIHGMTGLSQSLEALAKKYSLAAVTLATSDGLLLASSHKGISDDDVARYCRDFAHDPAGEHPGVALFSLEHKGSRLVGIVPALSPLTPGVKQSLVRETKDILNWWI